jgi:hypothetical protein
MTILVSEVPTFAGLGKVEKGFVDSNVADFQSRATTTPAAPVQ